VRLSDLAEATVVIYGYGREGRSVHTALRQRFPDKPVTVFVDGDPSETLEAAGHRDPHLDVAHDDLDLERFDVVVRSPGVSIHHGRLAAIDRTRTRVTTSTQLWFDSYRPDNVAAITGTKGKSTTSALTAHLLRASGRRVALAGNIGTAVLDLPRPPGDYDVVVLELSSYQLADLEADIAVGAFLNLYPEHADWHGGVEAYYADKARFIGMARRLAAGADDRQVVDLVRDHPDVRWFGLRDHRATVADETVDDAAIAAGLRAAGVLGEHNVRNACAALTLHALLADDWRDAVPALASFAGLPHRLQVVARGRRTWVDDSISTIPEATIEALEAYADTGEVTLLVGGYDRGQSYDGLCARVAGTPVRVITLPDTGERIARRLREEGSVAVWAASDLEQAVTIADRETPDGGSVLLSPGAPSYNAFTDFTARGDRFAALARRAEGRTDADTPEQP
jgi:UDP-N-acetylmuramoylalanine--D-glutamate ligase